MSKEMVSKFAAWQEANQLRRESVIDEYLGFLAKTKIKVRNLTDLSDLVAKHIAQVEGKPCTKSTLLRNPRYKSKIINFQITSLAPSTKALNSRNIADPTAKMMVTRAQLECGNLKRELERLNMYVRTLEEQLDLFQSQNGRLPGHSDKEVSAPLITDYEFGFVRTCQALRLLLSHLQLVVNVDISSQRILDLSKRWDNTIVDKEVAGPFFEWLSKQGTVEMRTIQRVQAKGV